MTALLPLAAQTVSLSSADAIDFAGVVDSNSPAYWSAGKMYIFNSMNLALRSESDGAGHFVRSRVAYVQGENRWRWIESVWNAPDGKLYAWYHTEPANVCPGQNLTAPEIGEMVSEDGVFFTDLGTILQSGAPPNCATANRYFAGGAGDFSVIPDRNGAYLYFLYSSYGGPTAEQGIAIARMASADVATPANRVFKFYSGGWLQPGLGGQATPIFPVGSDWSSNSPVAYWGPSVHWNTALRQYVMLLNYVEGDRLWDQKGIYMSFALDLDDPSKWTRPMKLMDGAGWYPQILGEAEGETDSIAGASARLFINGHSEWRLHFSAGPPHVLPKVERRANY